MRKHATLKEVMTIIVMVLSLLSLSLWVVYYIVDNYVDVDSIFGGNMRNKKIYLLESDAKYIPYLKKVFDRKYNIETTTITHLNLIADDKNVLLLIDKRKLDDDTIYAVQHFVKKGGSLVFNYCDQKLVSKITQLKPSDILLANKYDVQSPLLSAVHVDKHKVALYDSIYTYNKEAILDFTKDKHSYGVMWNGNYGKGNWIYFSFPFYVIQENDLKYTSKALSKNKHIERLLDSLINFAYYGYRVVKFPFIDTDKMVLIDEYVDYNFNTSVIKFLKQSNIKATIFINPNIVKQKLDVGDNIEIASMSIKDKWKLEKYTNQRIVGYSNENIIKPNIDELYHKYGFKYMLSNKLNFEIYYNDFVVLNYDGFNDINLDDDIKKIRENINFYPKYQIYTLTIHSHILGYKKNIKLLKEIINTAKKYPILQAKEVAEKYKDSSRISLSAMLTPSSLAVQITNDTLKEIKNFTFRVYSKYKFDKIESNFFNIRATIIKETPTYTDVKVEKMNKNIEFYLRFKK